MGKSKMTSKAASRIKSRTDKSGVIKDLRVELNELLQKIINSDSLFSCFSFILLRNLIYKLTEPEF